MYICEYCDYSTIDKGNYSHHKKSKKHLAKLDQIKIQDYYTIKKENDELKMKLVETEKKLLEKENEKLEAINKIYQEQAAKCINNTQNNTINIGTLNYINSQFPNAPPLEKITNFVINGIDTNDASQHDKFIGDIIYHHNNKILHTFLGDHIVKLYKKTDQTQQSFHTTDTSRLNYAVRIVDNVDMYDSSGENSEDISDEESKKKDDRDDELIRIEKKYLKKLKEINKEKEMREMVNVNKKLWITDKNGYKICKLLIDPTIKHVFTLLKNKTKRKIKAKSKKTNDLSTDLVYYQKINEIINDIDTKKLKTDINKYIAPIFNLAKK